MLQCYVGEIMKFILWCGENKPNWLMANGTDHIARIMEEHGGEGVHTQRSHTHTEGFGLLCSCDESPVLLLGEMTPHGVMEYAMGHCHIWSRQGYLSKSAYGTIHAADSICFVSTIMLGFQRFFVRSLEIFSWFLLTVDTISSAGGWWRAFTSWWR